MIRIPENIVKFSNGNLDLYKAWSDYFNHYKAEFLKKDVDYDRTVSFAEKTEKMDKAIKAEIAKIAGTNTTTFSDAVWATNPNYRWATFAVIGAMVDMILPETIIQDFSQFAEVRTGGFGDSFAFDIRPSDLFIVTKGGNNKRHAFAQKQYNGQAVLIPENRMITVEEDLYRVLAGKVNLAEFAMKCARSMETELSIDMYKAVDDTFTTLPANFKHAGYTQDDFINIAQRVTAANAGAKPVVFGTKLALSKVLPVNDYLKLQLGEPYTKMGYISTFMGVDLFEIPQRINWAAGDYSFALDDTKLYFVSTSSQKLVKVALEGETITIVDGQYQNANLTQRTTMNKKWAVGLITNAKYGIMTV